MGYFLGVDLGTTFTAAAVWRDGRTEIANLGNHGAAIPSVVLVRDDETVLTGEAANRRALSEPDRVAREFKRRLGDTTPILLGASPYSAEALMARLLRSVVADVAVREGGPPDGVALSHPANWGQYKIDLLRQAVRLADLGDVRLLTEPEAAVTHYASQERVEPGQIVAVFDLGGGTFDAAVLRKNADGFEILGQPEGIERLGGIDFDAAVFAHVARTLGGRLSELDEDDPAAVAAVARLRTECVAAKEALSSDTDTSIPVLLPNLQTEVRLTRSEFETMIRPALVDAIDALRRALRSAGVAPDQVHKVLLVGGSSRIPLVAQMVGSELGRPVAVDAHPKHAVASGAALAAAAAGGWGQVATSPPVPPVVATPPPVPAEPPPPVPAPPPPVTDPVRVTPTPPASPPPSPAPVSPPPVAPPAAVPPPVVPAPVAQPVAPGPFVPTGSPPSGGGRRAGLWVAAAVVVIAAAVGGFLAFGGDGDDDTATDGGDTNGTDETEAPDETDPPEETTTTPVDESTTEVPVTEEPCPELRDLERWACITSVRLDGDVVVAEYEHQVPGEFSIDTGVHLHFFGDQFGPEQSGNIPPDGAASGGSWQVWDDPSEFRLSLVGDENGNVDTARSVLIGAEQLCVSVTLPPSGHNVDESTRTGNCVPLPGDVLAAVTGL